MALQVAPKIELVRCETDDTRFLQLVQRIVNGALADFRVPELYLIHIDNWFDHKWLGWWSNWEHWEHGELRKLFVPPFNPNRVRSQSHLTWDETNSVWTVTGQGKPLHVRQPGLRLSQRKPLAQVSESAAFIWYSGNTAANQVGSMMLYQSGAEDYVWYASFVKKEQWRVDEGFRITRRELAGFEERGILVELN